MVSKLIKFVPAQGARKPALYVSDLKSPNTTDIVPKRKRRKTVSNFVF